MKRFLLFVGLTGQAQGGANGFVKDFSANEEAKRKYETLKNLGKKMDWAHIIDQERNVFFRVDDAGEWIEQAMMLQQSIV